jgi:hypothetical protein
MEGTWSSVVADLVDRTIASLENADARDEALATVKASRRVAVFTTNPVMVPAGRAWRLGVLLLDRSGNLYATGLVTRAIVPGIAVTNRSAAAEERRDFRRAAARGSFREGEVINHDYTPIVIDDEKLAAGSGPLEVLDGQVVVRLEAGALGHGTVPLEKYLVDRVELLTLGS